MEQSQILVVDSLDRLGHELAKINNNLARISRQLEELYAYTGKVA